MSQTLPQTALKPTEVTILPAVPPAFLEAGL